MPVVELYSFGFKCENDNLLSSGEEIPKKVLIRLNCLLSAQAVPECSIPESSSGVGVCSLRVTGFIQTQAYQLEFPD